MPPKSFPTHFLCIPLVNAVSRAQLTESLGAFAADVTSPTSYGIPPDAVRPVGTLHLTLGVMSFPKDEGLDRVTELLRSLKLQDMLASARTQVATRRLPGESEDTIRDLGEQGSGPLTITLRGLASMQPPSKTAVLYAPPVDGMGVLQAFCEQVRTAFMTAELMQEEGRPLLLHATIVNTVYVKNRKPKPVSGEAEEDGGRKPRKGRWGKRAEKLVIDARGILDRYEDQVWLEGFNLERIAICRMGAKKVMIDGVEDQAYEEVAEVGFGG
jgi:activating signal cointegrator complex subunit 1